MDLMRDGGAPMWVIVLIGGLNLIVGGVFAVRPTRRLLAVIAALGFAVACSVVAGTAADLAAVGSKIPRHPEWLQQHSLPELVLQGLGESMSPCILGFSLLSLVALECAVGLRRMAHSMQ